MRRINKKMGNGQNNQNNEISCCCNCITDNDSILIPLKLYDAYKSIYAITNTIKSSNKYKNDFLFLIDIKNMPKIFSQLQGTSSINNFQIIKNIKFEVIQNELEQLKI